MPASSPSGYGSRSQGTRSVPAAPPAVTPNGTTPVSGNRDARGSERVGALRSLYLSGVLGERCSRRLGLEPVEPVVQRPVEPEPKSLSKFCRHGHRYDEANTYVEPGGGRRCRTCLRRAQRRYRARK